MLKEFKEFAMRGNAIDMAVGIIIGSAFGKIVSSLVSNIIMPPIGVLLGKVDFSDLSLTIMQKTATSPAVVIGYGAFINTVIDFLIIAFSIFLVIQQINRFTKSKNIEKPTFKACPYCATNIAIQATRCPACTSQLTEVQK